MLFNLPLSKKKTKPTQPMEIKAKAPANEYGCKLSNTNNISGPTNLHKWLKSRYPYICVWPKKLTRGKSRCSNILFQCQCYSFWLKQTPLYHCTLVFSLTPCILQINGTFHIWESPMFDCNYKHWGTCLITLQTFRSWQGEIFNTKSS